MAEPPLTIGRGLIASSTAVGILLTVAVLWAMWPSAGAGVTAISTIATISIASDEQPTSTSGSNAFVSSSVTISAPAPSVNAAPAETQPVDTSLPVDVSPPRQTASTGEVVTTTIPHAAAIAINGSVLLVTTADAVGDRTGMEVTFDGVTPVGVNVVFVDQQRGLALLGADRTALEGIVPRGLITSIDQSTRVAPLSDTSVALTLVEDQDGALWVTGWVGDVPAALNDGVPLADPSGLLVGFCVKRDGGMLLVALNSIADLMLARADSESSWLGITIGEPQGDGLTVASVLLESPAATAGLLEGDTIVAIDDVAINSIEALDTSLMRLAPGVTVQVDILRAGEPLTLDVVLASSIDTL
jgi:hypothetical protein